MFNFFFKKRKAPQSQNISAAPQSDCLNPSIVARAQEAACISTLLSCMVMDEPTKNAIQPILVNLFLDPNIKPILCFGQLAVLGLHQKTRKPLPIVFSDKSFLQLISAYSSQEEMHRGLFSVERETGAAKIDLLMWPGTSYKQLCGILLHELTHGLARYVYENGSNPYPLVSLQEQRNGNPAWEKWKRFRAISIELAKAHQEEGFVKEIGNLFSSSHLENIQAVESYSEVNRNSEYIARVPQIICTDDPNLKRLSGKTYKSLLAYYRGEFLPDCKRYINGCRAKFGLPMINFDLAASPSYRPPLCQPHFQPFVTLSPKAPPAAVSHVAPQTQDIPQDLRDWMNSGICIRCHKPKGPAASASVNFCGCDC